MRPLYESIISNTNTSFKVRSYTPESDCETAGWHIHPEFELVYIKNGNGMLRIGNRTVEYKDGALVFLAGNIPHSDFGNKENPNHKEVVVQFSQEFAKAKLSSFPEFYGIRDLMEKAKHVLVFSEEVKNFLGKFFEKFDNLNNQGRLINLLSILDYLSHGKNHRQLFYSSSEYHFRSKETNRLEEIFEYVNNNYNKKISIGDIALKVGLTPNSFSRFFKKVTQRTFIDFVNEFKIGKSMELLAEKNNTIKEIMYLSGYNDLSYYSKQFKKYQGTTPSEYLKSLNEYD
jgi:AraC-like DNA-binding protein/quercetin dioxygenase-like cupin family protein